MDWNFFQNSDTFIASEFQILFLRCHYYGTKFANLTWVLKYGNITIYDHMEPYLKEHKLCSKDNRNELLSEDGKKTKHVSPNCHWSWFWVFDLCDWQFRRNCNKIGPGTPLPENMFSGGGDLFYFDPLRWFFHNLFRLYLVMCWLRSAHITWLHRD